MDLLNSSGNRPLFRSYYYYWHLWFNEAIPACQEKIDAYHDSTSLGTSEVTELCKVVLRCFYANIDGVGQQQISYTSVFFGLVPTVLSMLGSSTGELALLSSRRPLLSFLIACDSPVVSPERLFMRYDPRDFLEVPQAERLRWPTSKSTIAEHVLSVAQYLLMMASIANVVIVALELSQRTFSFEGDCANRWQVLAWTLSGSIIHAVGLWAFILRASWTEDGNDRDRGARRRRGFAFRSFAWNIMQSARNEFRLCINQRRRTLQWSGESIGYMLLSGLVPIGIVTHLFWGTCLFASTQLILDGDVMPIVARLVASAIVCRSVLLFELYGLRENTAVLGEARQPPLRRSTWMG